MVQQLARILTLWCFLLCCFFSGALATAAAGSGAASTVLTSSEATGSRLDSVGVAGLTACGASTLFTSFSLDGSSAAVAADSRPSETRRSFPGLSVTAIPTAFGSFEVSSSWLSVVVASSFSLLACFSVSTGIATTASLSVSIALEVLRSRSANESASQAPLAPKRTEIAAQKPIRIQSRAHKSERRLFPETPEP